MQLVGRGHAAFQLVKTPEAETIGLVPVHQELAAMEQTDKAPVLAVGWTKTSTKTSDLLAVSMVAASRCYENIALRHERGEAVVGN